MSNKAIAVAETKRAKNFLFHKWVIAGFILAVFQGLTGTLLADDGNTGYVLEEIIVSARKREESLQDVPVSVAAFSAEAIEKYGISNVTDIIGRTPGLYFSSSVVSPAKDYTFLVIRGVGANSGGEPSAATFVDGVYSPSLGFDIGFLDLERVEILRGPQGALFGRNTQAGALNIVSKRPDEERRAKIAFEIDEFETYRGQGAVSGPVIEDSLFMGASLDVASSDGYASNTAIGNNAQLALGQGKRFSVDANDYRTVAARTSLRYLPTADTEIYLALDYNQKKGNDVSPGFRRGCECYTTDSEFQLENNFENWGGALIADIDFDGYSLTSTTGFRRLTSKAPFDFDGTSNFVGNLYDIRTTQTIYSEELRLASTDPGRLSWVGGLYLFHEKNKQNRDFFFPDIDTFFAGINVDAQIIENKREGVALFGQVSYEVLENLELTLGGRYSYEKVENTADVDFQIPIIGFTVDFLDEQSASFNGFTPMASLSYHFSDNIMGYFTYAKGFKAGGFQKNTASLESNLPFDSETSQNYEAGVKMKLADGRLSVDASVYRIELEDQQLQAIVEVGAANVPISAIDNAGKGQTQGFELSTSLLLSRDFRVDANIGYVDAEYDQYTNEEGLDRSGDPFPYVPDWNIQFGAEYRIPLSTSGKELVLNGSYQYVGGYETGTGTGIDPIFEIDSYDRIDARLTLEAEKWDITVFADNLLDSYDVTHVWNAFFFANNALNYNQVLAPRRVGVRFAYNF